MTQEELKRANELQRNIKLLRDACEILPAKTTIQYDSKAFAECMRLFWDKEQLAKAFERRIEYFEERFKEL